MSETKYTFTRKAGEPFRFTLERMKELEPQLLAAHESVRELHSFVRVHPEIKNFCNDAWGELSHRLMFDTGKTYDQCSREIARRHPWVYLGFSEQGEFHNYDVDLAEVSR